MGSVKLFPNLPIEQRPKRTRAARVCIATYEILGPSEGGGIGAAYFALAGALAAAGHEVTILYLSSALLDESAKQHWKSQFHAWGIRFMPLPLSARTIDAPDCMLTARDAHDWLRRQNFDVIHFPELQGHGYYSVLAKHQGLDFPHTTLCIGTHSPISWIREQNNEAPYSPDELVMDFMERQVVALADVVVSPSGYMLRWMDARGWTLPATCYVQQNVAPPELESDLNRATRRDGPHRATELVFFGKLEERKGIGLFCDALDYLARENLTGFTVTFLGKAGRASGSDALSYISARSKRWKCVYRALTGHGRESALRFLAEDIGRVAIIPSLEDNLPNTVLECLAGNLPFLASRSGGIPELIADSDVERVTFPPTALDLRNYLARAVLEGVPSARLAIDPRDNRQRWIDWHAARVDSPAETKPAQTSSRESTPKAMVTVCLSYDGCPDLLRRSIGSLARQSWPNLELVVVNSTAADADLPPGLDDLREDLASGGLRINWKDKSEPGDWRRIAADLASGSYVLFMNAGDYLEDCAVATFAEIGKRTGADILTSYLALTSSMQASDDQASLGQYPFLGAAILPGVFRNHFGANVIFGRKQALFQAGLFRDSGTDCTDWEFLARAVLMGCRLEVIPRALARCSLVKDSGPHLPMRYNEQIRALTPYADLMPAVLRDLPKAAFTMKLHYERVYGLAHERLGESAGRVLIRDRLSASQRDDNTKLLDDESLLVPTLREMPERARKPIARALDAWLDYSSARSHLPTSRFKRASQIARQLLKGHYHRFAHGFGSALRDLRKPAKPR